jgi:hypothetical protein
MAGVDAEAGAQALRQTLREQEEARRQSVLQVLQGLMPNQGAAAGRESRVVTLEDGVGGTQAARVTAKNDLGVETRPGEVTTVITQDTADLSANTVLNTTAERIQLTIQNLDSTNQVHVRLGTGDATTGDLRLDPGAMYTTPGGVAYTGPVSVIATANDTPIVIVEYKHS